MLRVLVADADPTSRSGWAGLLAAEKDLRVKGAGSRERLYQRAASADVVVLVTGGSGAPDVAEIIGAVDDRGTPVVALTPASDPGLVAQAIAAGAAGALVADAAPIQVVAAVRAAAEGRRVEGETGGRVIVSAPTVVELLTATAVSGTTGTPLLMTGSTPPEVVLDSLRRLAPAEIVLCGTVRALPPSLRSALGELGVPSEG